MRNNLYQVEIDVKPFNQPFSDELALKALVRYAMDNDNSQDDL
ncbi:hypothetical protein RZE82_00310 [Mollicutes bacterium LVI A0039]|nr:hypothetical protein RZE82_00310 [Mollicutes bacterium LVI A0039]